MRGEMANSIGEEVFAFPDVQGDLAIPGKSILSCVAEQARRAIEVAQGS